MRLQRWLTNSDSNPTNAILCERLDVPINAFGLYKRRFRHSIFKYHPRGNGVPSLVTSDVIFCIVTFNAMCSCVSRSPLWQHMTCRWFQTSRRASVIVRNFVNKTLHINIKESDRQTACEVVPCYKCVTIKRQAKVCPTQGNYGTPKLISGSFPLFQVLTSDETTVVRCP
jgi:hypothetical protein